MVELEFGILSKEELEAILGGLESKYVIQRVDGGYIIPHKIIREIISSDMPPHRKWRIREYLAALTFLLPFAGYVTRLAQKVVETA